MKNLIKQTLILFSIILFFANSYASDFSIVQKKTITIGNFKIGIGSTVELLTDRKNLSGEQIFLGNVLRADGSELYKMMFSVKEKKVYYIDSQYFSHSVDQQAVIDPYIQVGSTCTGYAINGFLHQTNLANILDLDTLKKELMTEEGRSQLLAHAINEYYLTPAHRYSIRGILDGYGKKYGFKCKMLKTDSFDKAKDFLLKHLKTGLPVVVSFNIGREMVNSAFPLEMFEKSNVLIDERLWIPRRVGERNNGGHTIVASGSFEVAGKTYLTMLDSDWSEPRIWDLDLYLNHEKTALNEVEFISCK